MTDKFPIIKIHKNWVISVSTRLRYLSDYVKKHEMIAKKKNKKLKN